MLSSCHRVCQGRYLLLSLTVLTLGILGIPNESLGSVAQLNTVVDAANFLTDFAGDDELRARGESAGEGDERTVVDLLTDQVEFADVLVLNKTDLVSEKALNEVEATLKALNPGAARRVLHTGRFDFDRASRSAAWICELEGEHTPETEEYGVISFVYRAKGMFSLATHRAYVGLFSKAGQSYMLDPVGT